MTTTLTEEIRPLKGQHIAVLVPTYDGKMPIDATVSLIQLHGLIAENGGRMSLFSQKGMAIVESARNALLAEVMKHDDITGVLHLDADIMFTAMDALTLIAYADDKYDVVAGLYRAKTDKSFLYFFTKESGDGDEIKMDGDVMPCKRVPLGFCYVKREVLDVLWENEACRKYSIGPNTARLVYETSYRDGQYIGQDYAFCDKVQNMGYRIGALPRLRLGHIGTKTYEGSFSEALEGAKAGHFEIIDGDHEKVTL